MFQALVKRAILPYKIMKQQRKLGRIPGEDMKAGLTSEKWTKVSRAT